MKLLFDASSCSQDRNDRENQAGKTGDGREVICPLDKHLLLNLDCVSFQHDSIRPERVN